MFSISFSHLPKNCSSVHHTFPTSSPFFVSCLPKVSSSTTSHPLSLEVCFFAFFLTPFHLYIYFFIFFHLNFKLAFLVTTVSHIIKMIWHIKHFIVVACKNDHVHLHFVYGVCHFSFLFPFISLRRVWTVWILKTLICDPNFSMLYNAIFKN